MKKNLETCQIEINNTTAKIEELKKKGSDTKTLDEHVASLTKKKEEIEGEIKKLENCAKEENTKQLTAVKAQMESCTKEVTKLEEDIKAKLEKKEDDKELKAKLE